ncbi:hypothetical protein ES708_25275 [subsurface metagenome]
MPVPVPSLVLLSAVIGFCEVLQHTPRAVTDVPPLSVMLPPLCAKFSVMSLIDAVVTVGRLYARVEKDS